MKVKKGRETGSDKKTEETGVIMQHINRGWILNWAFWIISETGIRTAD